MRVDICANLWNCYNLSGLDDATTLGSSFGNSEILHIN